MTRGLIAALLLLGTAACAPPRYPQRALPAPPATSAEIDHATGFFTGSRGEVLFEQHWRPRAREAPRATIVVMHGLKDHSSRYSVLAERLARKGYAVHAFDLRGHGHSSGTRAGIESFDEYLDDLATFITRVKAEEHGPPVFLFGHSMGGAIATLTVLERNADVAGLLLSAAALRVNVGFLKVVGTKIAAAVFPRAGVFDLDLNDFSRDPAVVKECKADSLVYDKPAPARTAKELLNAISRIEQHRADVRVPLFVMHGESDVITDPAGSRALVEQASSKDKTLKVYPKLVHDLLHEPEKARVMHDIEEWLDAHAPAGAGSDAAPNSQRW